jgi:hypothetical protein
MFKSEEWNLTNTLINLEMGIVTIPRAKKNFKEKIQKWINIYVFAFKVMVIIASCFFIHMNVEEFKPKIHLIQF